MKKIDLIIFDLDGTLVDAYRAINKSFNFTMKALHYPLKSHAVIRRAVGWGDRNLLAPFVQAKDLPRALAVYRKHHVRSLIDHSRTFPGVRKMLARLKTKRYTLAVASNRPTKFSLILIRHLGLSAYFDYVLCADKITKAKPDPQILRMIMKRFCVTPDQTLYVGDMVIDAQAGKRAGVKTIIVTTGSSARSEIRAQKPWRIIRAAASLLRLV